MQFSALDRHGCFRALCALLLGTLLIAMDGRNPTLDSAQQSTEDIPSAQASVTVDVHLSVSGEGEGEDPYECSEEPGYVSVGGTYLVGDDLALAVPCPVAFDSVYQWSKDGNPLEAGDLIQGVYTRFLSIFNLGTDDSGRYTCVYDDDSKAESVFEANITVIEEVPTAGPLGLIALAVCCIVWGLRQRCRGVGPAHPSGL